MKLLALLFAVTLLVGCSKEAFQAYDPSNDSLRGSSASSMSASMAADLCSWENFRRSHFVGKVLVYRTEGEIKGVIPVTMVTINEIETIENSESRVTTRETLTQIINGMSNQNEVTEVTTERVGYEAECRKNMATFSSEVAGQMDNVSVTIVTTRDETVQVEAGTFRARYKKVRATMMVDGTPVNSEHDTWTGLDGDMAGVLIKGISQTIFGGQEHYDVTELIDIRE